jgi:hypothetical protein
MAAAVEAPVRSARPAPSRGRWRWRRWSPRARPEARRKIAVVIASAAVAAAGVAVAAARSRLEYRPPAPCSGGTPRAPGGQDAARRLDQAAALLAASALTDSAVEHYRGSFHNKAMYAPLAVSTLTLALRGAAGSAVDLQPARSTVNLAAIAAGVAGTGFHVYNISKRPGGLCWLNLFYAAPFGAPVALSLAGLLGEAADRARDGGIAGVGLARLVSAALLGTVAEAALLHFRGAYHNPAMLIPVTAGPVAAALLARAASTPSQEPVAARWSLRLLTAVGFVGAGFHAYGVHRNMGGWRNWSQNLLNGPPLPAPPAFTALSIAGLAALRLIREQRA